MTLAQQEYQNITIEDYHFVGPDRRPDSHHVIQEIRALQPLETIGYTFDTSEVEEVRVDEGGTASAPHAVRDTELHTVDITLDQPLESGEETTLSYLTSFCYEQPPAPEFRRNIGGLALRQLDVTVVFDEHSLPKRVWHTEWESWQPDSRVVSEIPVELEPFDSGPGYMARISLRELSNTTVGLRWEWSQD